MKKRFVAFSLALALLVGLTACGQRDSRPASNESESSAVTSHESGTKPESKGGN